jgi:hypothetical protein
MTYQYHDAIDRREAKERAMREEARLDRQSKMRAIRLQYLAAGMLCSCLEIEGDDRDCPIHGLAADECTCGPNDAPACASCRARNEHEALPF